MPRFAANLTMMFNEHAFFDRFQAAADAGFEAVEYLFPYDYSADVVAERLQAAGLKQALFNMPPGDWAAGERGLAALPERRDEFRQAVGKAVEYAKAIGSPLLHMMAGIADANNPAATASYRDALANAADLTARDGIGLVIEPINGRDMPGYFLNDFNRAIGFIADLNHANVRLQFDIYHRQIMHGDVLVGLEKAMPLIGHVQIASVPKRNEPGTGELDDFRIFAALDELGYRGYVGCEYRPAGETVAGLGWMKRL
ncbi:hydroxypyruvate isomerase family protein (plasmid) [Agrobacterium tumefaciens]|uniref:Hydroxypyruvate isomerase family protein n=1 Tax=Agrobacterium tumefaciens TaxID=358 RepID=A0AAP9EAW6_AGRTU|nr:2-oxo-tetronate isomerase [Agrobacterium tumefaciens]NSZ60086.1 hydroxypyruvate isomerase family protein [Agrobacterium tumefaciens]QDY97800.1 hydroxypyruvate isomerase family protein [Agrobacterium tumefaciens]UXS12930.1 hydroxypyruvate isomerase family protein [Agrobacterium tumefaciens]UXS20293.1 hydroxypyruvate isomerase family protein [Agrobacterium tumefaciens]UXS27937.1 hydroxypyruvate isomerase family protein [Agrobacterium tumefaciens]